MHLRALRLASSRPLQWPSRLRGRHDEESVEVNLDMTRFLCSNVEMYMSKKNYMVVFERFHILWKILIAYVFVARLFQICLCSKRF